MNPERPEHPAPRARPVVDVPIDSLLARAEELTRRWAIALMLERPLAEIGELPLGDLAREAPPLCAQVLRALGSDAELERLVGEGGPSGREASPPALRLAAIAGARDAAGAVAAAEALRGVLWETLLEELPKPLLAGAPAREIAALADRLAYVCARALATALSHPLVVEPGVRIGAAGSGSGSAPARGDVSAHAFERTAAVVQHAAIVDERPPGSPSERTLDAPGETSAHPRREPAGSRPSTERSSPPASHASPVMEAPVGWEESSPVPPPRYSSEIEIRDERGEEGPAAWIGSIGRQLARFEHDGLPFAVLLLEVLGLEQLKRENPQPESSRLLEKLEEAIAQLCPRWGSLTRESAGRFWLLAPRTDRVEAALLAERLIRAIGSIRSGAGVALDAAIGTAVCPEHGREAAALAAQADVELYAARSSMRSSGSSVSRPSASLE